MLSDDKPVLDDPVYNVFYNAALEWAAEWITGPQMEGHGAEVIEFARNMAMSILAGKRKVNFQQNFFDAVRADLYMTAAQKEFWLSQEIVSTPAPTHAKNAPLIIRNEIPRRARIDLMTPAELSIYNIMLEVENLGAHPLLTDVVVLLGDARNKLANWVDLQSAQQTASK